MVALVKSPCVISDIIGYVMMTAKSDRCSYIGPRSARVQCLIIVAYYSVTRRRWVIPKCYPAISNVKSAC